jgi:hypothetical protein
MTFKLVAASRISFVTLVELRMARPSYSPIIAFSSSGVLPVMTSTSQPRSSEDLRGVGVHLVGNEYLGFGHDPFILVFLHRRPNPGRYPKRPETGLLPAQEHGEIMRPAALVAFQRVGPVEPGAERLDVGGFHRRAAPDAQARRGIAIAGDVIGRAFLFQRTGESP